MTKCITGEGIISHGRLSGFLMCDNSRHSVIFLIIFRMFNLLILMVTIALDSLLIRENPVCIITDRTLVKEKNMLVLCW
jgi:hypothetical protein